MGEAAVGGEGGPSSAAAMSAAPHRSGVAGGGVGSMFGNLMDVGGGRLDVRFFEVARKDWVDWAGVFLDYRQGPY